MAEARKNDEVISLADSQVLRWLDELNGIHGADERAFEIRREIRHLRNSDDSLAGRRKLKELYAEMDSIQFKQDYLCLIIDREKDYYRACRGFSVNGITYHRLLGTNGGIKNETIVFISERHIDEIRRRIENDRDPDKMLVPAKLEAYKALACSASIPVSYPSGVIVVNDCETEFISDVIFLSNEGDGEPTMEHRSGETIKLNGSDGFGLMLPSLASRWSSELGLDYVMSGCCSRFSFSKGMVFTFDFLDFAEQVAKSYIIKDAWGVERDIRSAELILTTSMVKLWDSYESCESFMSGSVKNGYTFGVTKTCPKELEEEHTTNYQFIQPYDLSDEDIEKLTATTMTELHDVVDGDYRKALLFLKGGNMNERMLDGLPNDYIKGLMIEPALANDPYISGKIYQLIKNRINEAKVGILQVHGNYSMICGDPYALCQNMFGLPVTGLLKAGEIYNEYWYHNPADDLVCFRAPMTAFNNIRLVHPCRSDAAAYWYRYIKTATVLNDWDTTCMALNGCDFDGDLVMLTDDETLVSRHSVTPAIMCNQRKAEKKLVTEEDFIASNIASFGDDIGKITNRITSMFEVKSHFEPGSPEYETLEYRIKCGQLLQQDSIDKAKGIISKPMPKSWYDHHTVVRMLDDERRDLYYRIIADRKPYFMRYIYPALMSQYNKYVKNANKNAMREFGVTVDKLKSFPTEDLTDRQKEFLLYYELRMPVGTGACVMNRICRLFESTFDSASSRWSKKSKFDYTIMKSDAEYSLSQYYAVASLYAEYARRLKSYIDFSLIEKVDESERYGKIVMIRNEFIQGCSAICQNRFVLCNIILDLCYKKSSTKRFAWDICGEEIIHNLLARNNNLISFPSADEYGDIVYAGRRYSMETVSLEGEIYEHCP